MDATESPIEIEEHECCVCTSPFNDGKNVPVIGTCGHSICKSCREQNNKCGGRCPHCQHPNAFSQEVVNYELRNLLQKIAKLRENLNGKNKENEKEDAAKSEYEHTLQMLEEILVENESEKGELNAQIFQLRKELNQKKAVEDALSQCSNCRDKMKSDSVYLCFSCHKSNATRHPLCAKCILNVHQSHEYSVLFPPEIQTKVEDMENEIAVTVSRFGANSLQQKCVDMWDSQEQFVKTLNELLTWSKKRASVRNIEGAIELSKAELKQLLGERIYALIEKMYPGYKKVGKITGMLLEIDISELIAMLQNSHLFRVRVAEAIIALQQAGRSP